MDNLKELTLDEMKDVNGAGVADFFKEIIGYLLDGMTNAPD